MPKEIKKVLVVGAGLSGSSISRLLADLGHKVSIIEKSSNFGGLCRDEKVHGVLTHIFGPHYLHTNNKKIFNWLSQFSVNGFIENDYIVKSSIRGKLYDFPINRNTINEFFDINLKTSKDVESFLNILNSQWSKKEANNSEDAVLQKCGRLLYEEFFKGYTTKMWGREPLELDASICSRIPIRFNDKQIFHTDKYQGVPSEGYYKMFENMLNHENIRLFLNTEFIGLEAYNSDYDLIIYTGTIDSFFDYKFGKLPYRSLKFDIYVYPFPQKYNCTQINYPGKESYTRDVESKHITGQECNNTTVVRETPCYDDSNPMYPIINEDSKKTLNKYILESSKLKSKVKFLGRLGNFKYISMHECVEDCFELIDNLKKEGRI